MKKYMLKTQPVTAIKWETKNLEDLACILQELEINILEVDVKLTIKGQGHEIHIKPGEHVVKDATGYLDTISDREMVANYSSGKEVE